MELTIFAKKRRTKEGKAFNVYVSKLKKHNGDEDYVTVRFTGEQAAPNGDKCPVIIDVNKEDANISVRHGVNELTGEEVERKTLWIKNFRYSETKYVDHSLDDYE